MKHKSLFRIWHTSILFVVILFSSCSSDSSSEEKTKPVRGDIKFRQYLIQGEGLYKIHCENCHMEDGKGLANLIPPLANSDFMLSDPKRSICIIKNGMSGEISVNKTVFNHPMPSNIALKDMEIAEIATYIFNSWGNDHGMLTIPEVREALKECE